MMQQLSRDPVRTFTVGFQETQFNESRFARRIAQYLGTEHTELLVTARSRRGAGVAGSLLRASGR